jgi:hypothetical protein
MSTRLCRTILQPDSYLTRINNRMTVLALRKGRLALSPIACMHACEVHTSYVSRSPQVFQSSRRSVRIPALGEDKSANAQLCYMVSLQPHRTAHACMESAGRVQRILVTCSAACLPKAGVGLPLSTLSPTRWTASDCYENWEFSFIP